MPRCNYCNRKTSVSMICKSCDFEFCINCRLPEVHECNNIHSMKSAKMTLLADKLNNEKTNPVKILKI